MKKKNWRTRLEVGAILFAVVLILGLAGMTGPNTKANEAGGDTCFCVNDIGVTYPCPCVEPDPCVNRTRLGFPVVYPGDGPFPVPDGFKVPPQHSHQPLVKTLKTEEGGSFKLLILDNAMIWECNDIPGEPRVFLESLAE